MVGRERTEIISDFRDIQLRNLKCKDHIRQVTTEIKLSD